MKKNNNELIYLEASAFFRRTERRLRRCILKYPIKNLL